MAAAAKLELVADEESFFFRPPPGEPLQLHTFANKKQESLQHLLQHRCGKIGRVGLPPPLALAPPSTCRRPACRCRYPLSEVLQKRIKKHEKNRSSGGLIVQVLFDLLLPSGMLTQGGWDYGKLARGSGRGSIAAAVHTKGVCWVGACSSREISQGPWHVPAHPRHDP